MGPGSNPARSIKFNNACPIRFLAGSCPNASDLTQYTMGKSLRHSFVDAIDRVPGIDYGMLELLYNDTKAKFKSMSIKNLSSHVELRQLKRTLKRSHVPILLTSTSLFGEKDDLPHWIVLTGYRKNSWYINNPLGKRPNTRLGHRVLENNLGYRQVRCALIVRGLRQQGQVAAPL